MDETVSEQKQLEKLRDREAVRQTAHEELAPIAVSIGRKENAGCRFLHQHPA
jgi:hypothetical protein